MRGLVCQLPCAPRIHFRCRKGYLISVRRQTITMWGSLRKNSVPIFFQSVQKNALWRSIGNARLMRRKRRKQVLVPIKNPADWPVLYLRASRFDLLSSHPTSTTTELSLQIPAWPRVSSKSYRWNNNVFGIFAKKCRTSAVQSWLRGVQSTYIRTGNPAFNNGNVQECCLFNYDYICVMFVLGLIFAFLLQKCPNVLPAEYIGVMNSR